MADQNEPGFEEALKSLESIVTKLEDPEVPLEESIRLYEEGMKLSRYCTGILDNATLRIEKINDRSDPDTESAD
ncbi:MAG: exodeoxyribonuclease VII small subunit [Balneolaceae bacterium]